MGLTTLPPEVVRVIEGAAITEFATVSAAGVPIDTPAYAFPADDLATIDLATGLAYPAKAERARRNPKVGLLIEGRPGEPVIAIRGRAAVRDADLQANADRYLAETGFEKIAFGLTWEQAREAVWYWTRIIVAVAPERVLWWDNEAAMDVAPHVWQAPADTVFPASDVLQPGKASPPAQWAQRSWQELARDGIKRGSPAHLTLCDDDGYPLPIRARECTFADGRFRVVVPKGIPWAGKGTATLTFLGMETFVGTVELVDGAGWFDVERALPQLPFVHSPTEVLNPGPDLKATLLARLTQEAQRRGQPIPRFLGAPPAPTRLATLRADRFADFEPPTVPG